MQALHRQLQEKRELHYETRHLVMAGGLLLVYGMAMFYAGLILGEENGASGRFHSPRDFVAATMGASGDIVHKVQRVLFGSAVASPVQKRVDPAPVAAALPRERELVQVASMGTSIPARVPKPERKAEAKPVKVITSEGPIPLFAEPVVGVPDALAAVNPTGAAPPVTGPAPEAKPVRKAGSAAAAAIKPAPIKAAPTAAKAPAVKKARKVAVKAKAVVEPKAKVRSTVQAKPRTRSKSRSKVNSQATRRAFTLQVHALRNAETARDVARALGVFQGQKARVEPLERNGGQWYRVHLGAFATLGEARTFQKAFENRRGLTNTFPVSL